MNLTVSNGKVSQLDNKELNQKLDEFVNDYQSFLKNIKAKKDKIAFTKSIFKLNMLFEFPAKNFQAIRDFEAENEFQFDFKKYYNISRYKSNKEGEFQVLQIDLFKTDFKQVLEGGQAFTITALEQMETFVSYVTSYLLKRLDILKRQENGRGQEKNSPVSIAYAIRFYKKAFPSDQLDTTLFKDFSNRFGSTPGSIKKTYSYLNRESDTSPLHNSNLKHVHYAIDVLLKEDQKSQSEGKRFLKKLKG